MPNYIHTPPTDAFIIDNIANSSGGAWTAKELFPFAGGVLLALNTIADGDVDGVGYCACKWNGAAVTTDTWAQGAKVYWDDTAKKLTDTATGNTLVGFALTAKANGETAALVYVEVPPGT